MCFAPPRRTLLEHFNFQKWSEVGVLCTFLLGNVLRATRACTFSTSQLPKVVRCWCGLYILTWKCASRHTGVHFFDISKWFEPGVFVTCWLENVLRATTACTFSISQLPKVVRSWCGLYILTWKNVLRATRACTFSTSQFPKVVRCWCGLYILTWKCASRHTGAHFFDISKWSEPGVFVTFWLENVLRATPACNFSSLIWPNGYAPAALAMLLFDPPEPQIIRKTQWIATFLPFRAPASSFFSLFLFDLLTSFLLLPDSSHLCFSICPYRRKFDF